MFCTVHVHCMHIAGYSAHHSAWPQDSVITTYFPNMARNKKKITRYLCVFLYIAQKSAYPMVSTACCGRTQWRALCNSVSEGAEADSTLARHARRTASDLFLFPTCGANAAMLLLCLRVAALKMKVCLAWGFVKCKREFVQVCVCTSDFFENKSCCFFACG